MPSSFVPAAPWYDFYEPVVEPVYEGEEEPFVLGKDRFEDEDCDGNKKEGVREVTAGNGLLFGIIGALGFIIIGMGVFFYFWCYKPLLDRLIEDAINAAVDLETMGDANVAAEMKVAELETDLEAANRKLSFWKAKASEWEAKAFDWEAKVGVLTNQKWFFDAAEKAAVKEAAETVDNWNGDVDKLKPNVKKLTFHRNFDRYIKEDVLPEGLTNLTLGKFYPWGQIDNALDRFKGTNLKVRVPAGGKCQKEYIELFRSRGEARQHYTIEFFEEE